MRQCRASAINSNNAPAGRLGIPVGDGRLTNQASDANFGFGTLAGPCQLIVSRRDGPRGARISMP
jgi:hypothetical protein